ncbi:MAG: glucose-1-phosphate thymidylyltransferase [Actinomycetota bacterium]|nr:glucose-1-phosphate thymidylyltransferase [Actinomycetota bacterium]MDD5665738.1 glucose-1-phosphate thymidylyltransferase [Actinomycetota bacterium]
MELKGLILSGGAGTRLRPITHTSAKQLVPVANKPILFYGIEALKEAGISQIGIIVGDTEDEIREAVGDGSAWGVSITYIRQEAPLGLAHAVLTAAGFLADTPFVMYLGDNLIKEGIADFVDEFRRKDVDALILLAHVTEPQRFGVAELDGSRIVRLVEKPEQPPSDLALVGAYMFRPSILEASRSITPSWRDELEITDAIQHLIDHGHRVEAHVIDGWWKDTGHLEDLLEANRIVLENIEARCDGSIDADSRVDGRVIVEEGAEVVRSSVRGPAIIGKGTRIIDSYIGPFTSIYYGVTVEGSELEHSIVMENSSIANIPGRIENSLIGKNVEICRCFELPKTFRFVLGDNSRVGLI